MSIFEPIFNIVYLVTILTFVGLMTFRRPASVSGDVVVAIRLRWAFTALAIGDIGHVGFRVVAYLDDGVRASWIAAGDIATAVTFTLFYLCLFDAWRVRYGRAQKWTSLVLAGLAILRFALLLPAANRWTNRVPPLDWSIYRNLPLFIIGLGVASCLRSRWEPNGSSR